MNDEQDLPPGWAVTSLGEVLPAPRPKIRPSPDSDLPFVGMDSIAPGSTSIREVYCFADMKSAASHFLPGDVLYGRMRPYLNKVYRANFEGTCSAEFIVIPESTHIESDFLKYLLHSRNFVSFASNKSSGDRPRVDIGDISAYSFGLPPLNEQRRIVEKIDELFSQIEAGEQALQRARKLLERYRQSVLNGAVTGELTRDWRERHKGQIESGEALLRRILRARREAWEQAEFAKMHARGAPPKDDRSTARYQEPAPPDTSGLPELPKGWVWATLPMLGEFGRGKSRHRPRNDPKLYGGPYPFIQTGDVRHSGGRIAEYSQTYNEHGLSQSKMWPSGTICITIAANIAETGILQFQACFPDSVVGLVPIGPIAAEYVELFLRTAKADVERYAPATAQKNINLDILSSIVIAVPPFAEQRQIADRVDANLSEAGAIDQVLRDELARSAKLRRSIPKAAFAGKLVPQDPTDESASLLLERIRTERAASMQHSIQKRTARRGRPSARREAAMSKTRKEIEATHLRDILRAGNGGMAPEALWQASELDIDQFYKQLREEVAAGHLREERKGDTSRLVAL
jgi:type I restriction enzyme, S subunit